MAAKGQINILLREKVKRCKFRGIFYHCILSGKQPLSLGPIPQHIQIQRV